MEFQGPWSMIIGKTFLPLVKSPNHVFLAFRFAPFRDQLRKKPFEKKMGMKICTYGTFASQLALEEVTTHKMMLKRNDNF